MYLNYFHLGVMGFLLPALSNLNSFLDNSSKTTKRINLCRSFILPLKSRFSQSKDYFCQLIWGYVCILFWELFHIKSCSLYKYIQWWEYSTLCIYYYIYIIFSLLKYTIYSNLKIRKKLLRLNLNQVNHLLLSNIKKLNITST